MSTASSSTHGTSITYDDPDVFMSWEDGRSRPMHLDDLDMFEWFVNNIDAWMKDVNKGGQGLYLRDSEKLKYELKIARDAFETYHSAYESLKQKIEGLESEHAKNLAKYKGE